jgi:hypothetical protein
VTHVIFGTAQFYGLADPTRSQRVLEEAWRCGIRRFDTAPSYGFGKSEALLGRFLEGREGVETVTTKVGLAPPIGRPGPRKVVVGIAKAVLPRPVARRLRSAVQSAASGRFGVDEVRASVDRSLRRLDGRIDRLLLHEVLPDEITDELLDVLSRYRQQGDVGALGVATRNHRTAAALQRGHGLFTVAHTAIGPLDAPVELPDSVTTRVGHGLLGVGGEQLRVLRATLLQRPALAAAWEEATAGTAWEGRDGLTRVLLGRGATIDCTDVIVATTRVEHVASAYALAGGREPLPPAVAAVLGRLVDEVRAMPPAR